MWHWRYPESKQSIGIVSKFSTKYEWFVFFCLSLNVRKYSLECGIVVHQEGIHFDSANIGGYINVSNDWEMKQLSGGTTQFFLTQGI